MSRRKQVALGVAVLAVATVGAIPLLTSGTAASGESGTHASKNGSSRAERYTAPLASGKREGYLWGVGAEVPRYRPLKWACLLVTTVPPPPPGQGYVEASDLSTCGRLTSPSESISILSRFEDSEESAGVLIATLYAPTVGKVAVELVGGGEEVVRTKLRKTKRPSDKGVPRFRYVAFFLDPGVCAERITTYDHAGAVIARENAEPGC